MMKIALHLPRLNHLRVLGPIAHAALARDWRAHFLCPDGGPKDDAGAFLGHPDGLFGTAGWLSGATAERVMGAADMVEKLRPYHVVVSVGLRLPDWMSTYVVPATRGRTRWVSAGYLQEELLHVLEDGPARLAEWDLVTTSSARGVEVLTEELARRRLGWAALVARQSRRPRDPPGKRGRSLRRPAGSRRQIWPEAFWPRHWW